MSQQMPYGHPGGGYQGGDPKAQAAAEKAYRKAQRPFYKKKRFLLPAAFIALIVVIASTQSGSSTNNNSPSAAVPAVSGSSATSNGIANNAAAANVAVMACDVEELAGSMFAKVGYTINNPTSKASTYFVEFSVTDATGAKVSSANGIEPNVLQGRPSQGEAEGNVSSAAKGPFKCEVGKVTRTAS